MSKQKTHAASLATPENFLLDLSIYAFTRAQADRLAYDIRQKLGDPTVFCSLVFRSDGVGVYRISTEQNARLLSHGLVQIIPELDTATAKREFRS